MLERRQIEGLRDSWYSQCELLTGFLDGAFDRHLDAAEHVRLANHCLERSREALRIRQRLGLEANCRRAIVSIGRRGDRLDAVDAAERVVVPAQHALIP